MARGRVVFNSEGENYRCRDRESKCKARYFICKLALSADRFLTVHFGNCKMSKNPGNI